MEVKKQGTLFDTFLFYTNVLLFQGLPPIVRFYSELDCGPQFPKSMLLFYLLPLFAYVCVSAMCKLIFLLLKTVDVSAKPKKDWACTWCNSKYTNLESARACCNPTGEYIILRDYCT